MAEILGVPYTEIAIAAIIPTVLFYFANYIHCDLHAVKHGLSGIPRDELPKMTQMLRKLHLFAPLILLSRRDLFVGPVRLRWIWLFAGPVVLVAIFHGFELGAEHVIERIAYQLNGLLGVCR